MQYFEPFSIFWSGVNFINCFGLQAGFSHPTPDFYTKKSFSKVGCCVFRKAFGCCPLQTLVEIVIFSVFFSLSLTIILKKEPKKTNCVNFLHYHILNNQKLLLKVLCYKIKCRYIRISEHLSLRGILYGVKQSGLSSLIYKIKSR